MSIKLRKRARRSNATATATSITSTTPSESNEVAPPSASRAVWNPALRLPTELIYTIAAITIGDYIGDMMLLPSENLHWDAIMALLHVSRTFRGCTIELLYHLWGSTFIRERTKYAHLPSAAPRRRGPADSTV
jgi:hypothetical protein